MTGFAIIVSLIYYAIIYFAVFEGREESEERNRKIA